MAYFANGCEGLTLDNQCAECKIGDQICPIASVQLVFNYDQIGNDSLRNAMKCLVDDKGLCQMKPLLDKIETK